MGNGTPTKEDGAPTVRLTEDTLNTLDVQNIKSFQAKVEQSSQGLIFDYSSDLSFSSLRWLAFEIYFSSTTRNCHCGAGLNLGESEKQPRVVIVVTLEVFY